MTLPIPHSDSDYNRQRGVELRALTDPRVKRAIHTEGIRLIDYREYRRLRSATTAAPTPCRQMSAVTGAARA